MNYKINKKSQVTIYIVAAIAMITVVVIAAVLAPLGVLFNTQMYAASEDILAQAQGDLDNIQDATVRAAIDGMINESLAASEMNIEVNNDLFQYSWILVIGITALSVFLLSRRLIEVGGGGFVG